MKRIRVILIVAIALILLAFAVLSRFKPVIRFTKRESD